MQELITALGLEISEETKIVFQMFNDIEYEEQVKRDVLLPSNVRQLEVKLLVSSLFAQSNGLRRNIIAPQCAVCIHMLLQEPEYLTGSASHLAYRVRLKMVPLQHGHHVFYFPPGILQCASLDFFQVAPSI